MNIIDDPVQSDDASIRSVGLVAVCPACDDIRQLREKCPSCEGRGTVPISTSNSGNVLPMEELFARRPADAARVAEEMYDLIPDLSWDPEALHGRADELLCRVLRDAGYHRLVEAFETLSKHIWYA